jgi:phosphoglycerate dehydrogenase-like enzyme
MKPLRRTPSMPLHEEDTMNIGIIGAGKVGSTLSAATW